MKKHLIPDRLALPRLPYRLLRDSWWLEEDVASDYNAPPPIRLVDLVAFKPHRREVAACN